MARNPNGYGTIRKLSGKRRKPFAVYITTGFEMTKAVPKIDFLEDILSADLFEQVQAEYDAHLNKVTPKAKQVQKCIGYYETKQLALIALAEYNKQPYDLDARNTTFGQVYEILLKDKFDKMKPSAKAAYVTAYKRCDSIKDIKMVELKKAHMQKIIDDNSEMSKPSLNNLLKLFNAVYKFSLENDICEKDYASFVTAESEAEAKDKTPFSREEITLLWDNINWIADSGKKSKLTGMCYMDAVLIHIYTGVRPQELLDLKKEDVHLEERYIDLRGTKTKAAKRIVPIHKKIIPLLEKRIIEAKTDYVFPDNTGKPLIGQAYRQQFFAPMCEHFGLNHTPHECRHTFATFGAASNMNKVLLKKIIGHAAGDLTEDTYTHTFIEDLIREIDKLDI